MADLRKILTFTPHGRCHRATHNDRRFILLQDRDGLSLYEQTPLDPHVADDPDVTGSQAATRSRRRRRVEDDSERRLHGTLRGLGLIGFDDDILPAEQRESDEL